jgi:HlyD family secretion protein
MPKIKLNTKIIVIGVVIGLVLLAVIILLARPSKIKKVSTTTVEKRTVDLTISASGKVIAEEKTQVNTLLTGKVEEVFVEEGMVVAAGEPLLSLESDELALAVEQARLNLRIAQNNEENARLAQQIAQDNLNKLKAGASSEELAVSVATLNQYQAGIDTAKQGVEDIKRLNQTSLDQAEKAVEQAQQSVDAAKQAMDDAKKQWDDAKVATPSLPDYQLDSYEAAYNQAKANYEAAKLALESAELALENTKTLNEQALHNAQSQLETAEKTYELGQAQYNLTKAGASDYDESIFFKQLYQAQEQYELTQRQTELAELNLESAELELDKAIIKAPIPGLVAKINVTVGDMITGRLVSNAPLAVIIDVDSLKFEASVDETDVAKVKKGQRARIFLDAFPDKSLKGKVEKVGVTPVPTEGGATAYATTIAFLKESIEGLREGMNGDTDIIVGKVQGILALPASAILEENGKAFVFLIKKNKTLEKREVELGEAFDELFEIESGLEEGQRIVESDVEDLKEGEKVKW